MGKVNKILLKINISEKRRHFLLHTVPWTVDTKAHGNFKSTSQSKSFADLNRDMIQKNVESYNKQMTGWVAG